MPCRAPRQCHHRLRARAVRDRVLTDLDAVVVGSGPNGLAAAITLAQAGLSVRVLEATEQVGGAARSAALTEPGFVHDVGSAIHPLGVASPFFKSLQLDQHGLEWVQPPASVAHPLDRGRAGIGWRDLDRTVDALGIDGASYRRLIERYVRDFDDVLELGLRPILRIPRRPVFAARFGFTAAQPAAGLADRVFSTDEARGLFLGHANHAILPLTAPLTAAFGLLFAASSHAGGWPFPRGGAQSLTDALARRLGVDGGEIEIGRPVRSLRDLPPAPIVILAISARQAAELLGPVLPDRYRRRLARFALGPGVAKVDYALSDPIPWTHADVAAAATVHVGGAPGEIVAAEAAVADGRHPDRPFVFLAQHTLFDPSRAPEGRHTAWAYCHVPNGSTVDVSDSIDAQIERFAPGFRDTILARTVSLTPALERSNPSLIGGDIGGGSYAGLQMFARPTLHWDPHRTPDPRFYIGSASSVPGGGVHGMAGHQAARSALARLGNDGRRDEGAGLRLRL